MGVQLFWVEMIFIIKYLLLAKTNYYIQWVVPTITHLLIIKVYLIKIQAMKHIIKLVAV